MSKPLSSPAIPLLAGLAVTLAAVTVFSWYTLHQIAGLRNLQTQIVDRNRKDSLQLLRIQNDLNSLGLAMRDMLGNDEPYPLQAWKGQFDRIQSDLDDALRAERQLAADDRGSSRQVYLADSLSQFWTSADQIFALAASGNTTQARGFISNSLQPQEAALSTAVARLLVQNNETEQQAVTRIQGIYAGVERNIYIFLAGVLVAIVLISLYLIRANRRLFDSLAALSGQRSDLARKLITMQEEVLRSISRELHDEFGQILTAMGAMLGRAEKQPLPETMKEDLREIRDVAQSALEKTRSFSLALHPSILDEGGLEQAIDWYIPVFQKQTGIAVRYEKAGRGPEIPDSIAIHVYRVLQEALNNVAKHSKSPSACVRLLFTRSTLQLEIEDGGTGIPAGRKNGQRPGIGLVAMRERAELLHGGIEFARGTTGGALVRLIVPLQEVAAHER